MRLTGLFIGLLAFSLVSCNNSNKTNSQSTTPTGDTTKASPTPDKMMSSAEKLPPIPVGAKVFFVNLKDGQQVSSPVKVIMGVSGMKVDTAGKVIVGTGHHHLLIDAGDSLPRGQMVPKDATHLHFGNAQTETEVKLSPGKHKLTLQFADGVHRSYGSQLSASITVDVK